MFPNKVNREANQELKGRDYQSKKFISQKDHIFELGSEGKEINEANKSERCNSKVNFLYLKYKSNILYI